MLVYYDYASCPDLQLMEPERERIMLPKAALLSVPACAASERGLKLQCKFG